MSLGYFTASLVHSTLFCGNLNVPQMKCFSLTIVCVDAKYGNTCIPQKAMSQTLARTTLNQMFLLTNETSSEYHYVYLFGVYTENEVIIFWQSYVKTIVKFNISERSGTFIRDNIFNFPQFFKLRHLYYCKDHLTSTNNLLSVTRKFAFLPETYLYVFNLNLTDLVFWKISLTF